MVLDNNEKDVMRIMFTSPHSEGVPPRTVQQLENFDTVSCKTKKPRQGSQFFAAY